MKPGAGAVAYVAVIATGVEIPAEADLISKLLSFSLTANVSSSSSMVNLRVPNFSSGAVFQVIMMPSPPTGANAGVLPASRNEKGSKYPAFNVLSKKLVGSQWLRCR